MRLTFNVAIVVSLVLALAYAAVAWVCVHRFYALLPSDALALHDLGAVHASFMQGSALVLALPTLALAELLRRRVIRPVAYLAGVAKRIGSGCLDEPVVCSSRDEIGELGRCLDVMREELKADRRRLVESEAEKRRFYHDTILAVTDGRLRLCEADEIEGLMPSVQFSTEFHDASELDRCRALAQAAAARIGMEASRAYALEVCLGEALGNVVKHARLGWLRIHAADRVLRAAVADNGPGIDSLALPRATLQRGYSTRVSLGMGFSLMLELADRVYLHTGPDGTTVIVELAATTPPQTVDDLLAAWPSL